MHVDQNCHAERGMIHKADRYRDLSAETSSFHHHHHHHRRCRYHTINACELFLRILIKLRCLLDKNALYPLSISHSDRVKTCRVDTVWTFLHFAFESMGRRALKLCLSDHDVYVLVSRIKIVIFILKTRYYFYYLTSCLSLDSFYKAFFVLYLVG